MIRIVLFWYINLCFISAYALNDNKANFTIEENEASTLVYAKLPLSFKQAFYEDNPGLTISQNQEEFDKALFAYFKSNVIFLDEKRDSLQLLTFSQGNIVIDSNEINYILEFEKGSIFIISNSFMFNINDDQKNLHTIVRGSLPISFITSKAQVDFYVEKPFNKRYILLAIPVFLIICFFALKRMWQINKKYRRKKKKSIKSV